jgi:hypothetical protein
MPYTFSQRFAFGKSILENEYKETIKRLEYLSKRIPNKIAWLVDDCLKKYMLEILQIKKNIADRKQYLSDKLSNSQGDQDREVSLKLDKLKIKEEMFINLINHLAKISASTNDICFLGRIIPDELQYTRKSLENLVTEYHTANPDAANPDVSHSKLLSIFDHAEGGKKYTKRRKTRNRKKSRRHK